MQITQTPGVQQYTAVSRTAQAAGSAEKLKEQGAAKPSGASAAAKTDRVELSADAKITKMSAEERTALVASLRAEQATQMNRFVNMMAQTFNKQGLTAAAAQGGSFGPFLSSGNFLTDAQNKADAQTAVAADGYWGVEQTAGRIFSMALSVAGDDPAKLQQIQKAVVKGFNQVNQAWGGRLPTLAGDTSKAVDRLFNEHYAQDSEKTAEPAKKQQGVLDALALA